MIKLGFGYAKDAVKFILCLFAPSNIRNTFTAIRGMSVRDLIAGFFRLHLRLAYTLIMFLFTIFWWVPDSGLEIHAFKRLNGKYRLKISKLNDN